MKKFTIFLLILFTFSCTITRNFKIEPKTEAELIEYYKSKNVDSFLVVKDYNSFKALAESERVFIPQNFIFDVNGKEIAHFDDKLCAYHTLSFLENYHPDMQIKYSDYNLASFLENFDSFENSINKEEILKTYKIRVFVNTATYGDKMKVNKEAFEIFNLYSDKYQVYIINLDVGEWNGE